MAVMQQTYANFASEILEEMKFLERTLGVGTPLGIEDRYIIAEAATLRWCAMWEAFVDEEMLRCFSLDTSKMSKELELSLPKQVPRDLAQAILFRDRYESLGDIGKLRGFARKHLSAKCNPFEHISKGTRDVIHEMYMLRNYLAHRSAASKRKLMQRYRRNHGRTKFVRPGVFLVARRARMLVHYLGTLFNAVGEMLYGLTGKQIHLSVPPPPCKEV